MYCDELPTGLMQQVAKIRDRAFFAVQEAHHLSAHTTSIQSFVAI
jgi:hypothetical protein